MSSSFSFTRSSVVVESFMEIGEEEKVLIFICFVFFFVFLSLKFERSQGKAEAMLQVLQKEQD